MELLLLSNSTLPGKARMEHALPLIAGRVKGRRSAVFVPFAGVTQSWDDYTAKAAAVMAPMGVSVTGIHSVADPIAAIEKHRDGYRRRREHLPASERVSQPRAAGADCRCRQARSVVYRLERGI